MIHLCDLFWTFQGEGKHAGRRALFVRMPYCNLACSWCDTSFNHYTAWTEEDFISYATKENVKFAVVTGGEPMMHKHTKDVVRNLKALGFEIACESNGTFPIVEGIDFVTVSPKRDAHFNIHPHAFIHASEFKYVVDKNFDFTVLNRHDLKDGRRYSLSPEFTDFEDNVRSIVDYIEGHPGWMISLQTHKWLGIP